MSRDLHLSPQAVSHDDGAAMALLGRGTLFQLLARISGIVSSYVIHISLGRMLGPVRYGTIGTVLSVLTIQRTLVVNVTRQVVSKYVAQASHPVGRIRHWSFVVQSTLTLVVAGTYFLLSDGLARLLGDSALGLYFRVSAPFIPLVGWYAVQVATLNGIRRFAEQALTIIVYNAARLALALGYVRLISSIDHETSAILGFVSAPLVASIVAQGFYMRRRTEPVIEGAVTEDGWRENIIRYVRNVFFSAIGVTLLLNSGQLIVKAFGSDPAQAGYYTAASSMAQVPYLLMLSFSDVIIPVAVQANRSAGSAAAGNVILRTCHYMLWIAALVLAMVGPTASSLMTWVYSSEYALAGPLIPWACAAFCLLAMFMMLGNAILAIHSSRFVLLTNVGVACSTVILGTAGTVVAGTLGFFAAMAASLSAGFIAYILYLGQQGGSFDLRKLRGPILGAALVATLATLVQPQGIWLAPLYAVLGSGYMALLWLSGTITPQEKRAAIRFCRDALRPRGS